MVSSSHNHMDTFKKSTQQCIIKILQTEGQNDDSRPGQQHNTYYYMVFTYGFKSSF